jgi:hypothetical protein
MIMFIVRIRCSFMSPQARPFCPPRVASEIAQLHGFSPSAVSGFGLSFNRAAAGQNKGGTAKGTSGVRREGGMA